MKLGKFFFFFSGNHDTEVRNIITGTYSSYNRCMIFHKYPIFPENNSRKRCAHRKKSQKQDYTGVFVENYPGIANRYPMFSRFFRENFSSLYRIPVFAVQIIIGVLY